MATVCVCEEGSLCIEGTSANCNTQDTLPWAYVNVLKHREIDLKGDKVAMRRLHQGIEPLTPHSACQHLTSHIIMTVPSLQVEWSGVRGLECAK